MKALKYMMMGMLVSLTASCGNDWLDVESSTKIPKPPYRIWMMWNIA